MNTLTRRAWLRWAVALLSGGCALTAKPTPSPAPGTDVRGLDLPPPGEHFYVIVFASQNFLKQPAYSHTFATVAHAAETGGGPCGQTVQQHHTISWLPATLDIHPLRLHPEQGVNLGLLETLDWALKNGERISEWGPYECRPRFYRRFLVQKDFMESGSVGYQCVDNIGESARTGDGCDCIHAITDMDSLFSRANYPLIWYGEDASGNIVERLHERDWLLSATVIHDWLNEPLGLNAYPIIHRRYKKPLLSIPLSRIT
jgi:hypothetical protein